MSEEGKNSHHHEEHQAPPPPPPPPPEYGTFQSPPQTVIGFPQPVPSPGATAPSPEYYVQGYQAVPGYVVEERRLVREPRLPCGIGLGWFLFIIGFFLAAIPWYLAAFVLLCTRSIDHREKPGYITCTIAAVLSTIALIFGLTRDDW